jgi:hypothetical protein
VSSDEEQSLSQSDGVVSGSMWSSEGEVVE